MLHEGHSGMARTYEESSTMLCLVAKHEVRTWAESWRMCPLLADAEFITLSANTSLGIASTAMGKIPYWLCWSILGQDFCDYYGCPLQVAIEAHVADTPNSTGTIRKLWHMFATHGIPAETIATDNGSIFTSSEFQHFMDMNEIRHLTTAPYHPASNELAEQAAQALKPELKKMTSGNIDNKFDRFLFQYRITPHTTTGRSPAELLNKWTRDPGHT